MIVMRRMNPEAAAAGVWHLRGSFVPARKETALHMAQLVYKDFASAPFRAELLIKFCLVLGQHSPLLRRVRVDNDSANPVINGGSLQASLKEGEIKQLADLQYLYHPDQLGKLAYRLTYRAAVTSSMVDAYAADGVIAGQLQEPYIETNLLDRLYRDYQRSLSGSQG